MIFVPHLSPGPTVEKPRSELKSELYRWRNVSIVAGGFISGITYHPKEQGLAYARTDIGGAYRWDAKNSRWIPLLDWITKPDWNLYGIESLAIDPSDPKRLYLACGTYTNEWGTNGAILSSNNQGRSFYRCPLPLKLGGNEDGRSMGERLAVDPKDGKTLFFGTRNQGLWTSRDWGTHWDQVIGFPVKSRTNGIGVTSVAFDPEGPKLKGPTRSIYVGVASTEHNLYHSADGGSTWEAVPNSPSGLFLHHLAISANHQLFATFSDSAGPNGVKNGAVFRFDLTKAAWSEITPIRPNPESGKAFGYAGLAIDPKDGSTLVVSTIDRWNPGDDVFYSTDTGKTWTALAKTSVRDASAAPYMNWGAKVPRFGWWIGAVGFDPFNKSRVLYGTGANIWGCDDVLKANVGLPTIWTVRGVGIEETADIDLLSPASGPPLITALGDIGGFTHIDLDRPAGGMSMNPMLGNTDCLASSISGKVVVKVGRPDGRQASGGISHDSGLTFTSFPNSPVPGATGGSVAVSADGKIVVWSPNGRSTYWTQDDGVTWNHSSDSTLKLAADSVDPSIFYGLDQAFKSRGTYISRDFGKNFSRVGDLPAGGGYGALRSSPDRSGVLYLPSSAGAWISNDGGATYSKLSSVDSAESLGFGKAKPGSNTSAIYLNGKILGVFGVFRSDDAGSSWIRITDPNHEYGTRGVVIGDPKLYGRVYLGTNGRGVLYADPFQTDKKE